MSGRREVRLFTVDAFTSLPFAGNPAAVCPLTQQSNLDDETLQNIAMEMNRTTAFVTPLKAGEDHATSCRFGLRWFTPANELKLCGHATLAAAAVLFYRLGNSSTEVTFETRGGTLSVKKDGDFLSVDFPLGLSQKKTPEEYQGVIKALGDIPGVEDVRWCASLNYLLVRLRDGWSRAQFEAWRCDAGQLKQSVSGVLIVMVTTRGGREQGYEDSQGRQYDFVSRCFAPWLGILEDPVTGSALTVLADYWKEQLGKTEFYVRQCSARGGEIGLRVEGSRVHLRGQATLVLEGTLRV